MMDQLKALGIDTDEGLAYCADDPEFFEEMLDEYAAEAAGRLEELEESCQEGNWSQYGILAHTVKSTSRMIGAKEFSEKAREMEMAAKEGSGDVIRAGHDRFVAEYRALSEGIRNRRK